MINTVLKQLQEKYHFNSGGCCYVAYLIAKEMERMKESFKLVIQSSEWKGNHYCIYSTRFGLLNPFNEYSDSVEFAASSETIRRIYNENEWSIKYDTRNNAKLEEEIKYVFSIYDSTGEELSLNKIKNIKI